MTSSKAAGLEKRRRSDRCSQAGLLRDWMRRLGEPSRKKLRSRTGKRYADRPVRIRFHAVMARCGWERSRSQ